MHMEQYEDATLVWWYVEIIKLKVLTTQKPSLLLQKWLPFERFSSKQFRWIGKFIKWTYTTHFFTVILVNKCTCNFHLVSALTTRTRFVACINLSTDLSNHLGVGLPSLKLPWSIMGSSGMRRTILYSLTKKTTITFIF